MSSNVRNLGVRPPQKYMEPLQTSNMYGPKEAKNEHVHGDS